MAPNNTGNGSVNRSEIGDRVTTVDTENGEEELKTDLRDEGRIDHGGRLPDEGPSFTLRSLIMNGSERLKQNPRRCKILIAVGISGLLLIISVVVVIIEVRYSDYETSAPEEDEFEKNLKEQRRQVNETRNRSSCEPVCKVVNAFQYNGNLGKYAGQYHLFSDRLMVLCECPAPPYPYPYEDGRVCRPTEDGVEPSRFYAIFNNKTRVTQNLNNVKNYTKCEWNF